MIDITSDDDKINVRPYLFSDVSVRHTAFKAANYGALKHLVYIGLA